MNMNSMWKDKLRQQASLYEAVWSILGTSAVIFPMVGIDGSSGGIALPTATTYTTLMATSSGVEAVVTNSKAGGATALISWGDPWRSKPAIRKEPGWQGCIPAVAFNGTNELMTTPDVAYFTRAGAAWSAGLWVELDSVSDAMSFFSKYDNTTGATQIEWDCGMNASGQPYINVHDDSVPARIGRLDATSLLALSWNHLVFVDAGTNASTGLDVYLNGVAVDDTDDNSGVFAAMEDKTSLVRIGARYGAAALEQYVNGRIAGGSEGPFFVQSAMTAAQVKRKYQLGLTSMELG